MSNKSYTLLKDLEETTRTPQKRGIVKVFAEKFGLHTEVPHDDLIAALDEAPTDVFETSQGAFKVLRFYERQLKDDGYISVNGGKTRKADADDEEGEEKTTSAKKPAKRGKKKEDALAA